MEEKINMFRRFGYLLLVLISILSACTDPGLAIPTILGPTVTLDINAPSSPTPFGPVQNTPSVPAPVFPNTATATPTRLSTLTQVPQESFSQPSYTLNATLDYADHSLVVAESIFYQNATSEILYSFVLAVEPNNWRGCFTLDGLTIDGQEVTKTELVNNRLEVPLRIMLLPGGTLEMSLRYNLHLPPADSRNVFGYNIRQVNLVNWFPFIVPYSGGWVLHPPADVGEHIVYDAATYDVTVALADATLPVSLAASAPAEMETGSWHYHLQNARTFVFSASTTYQSVSTTTNGVTVISYYFDEDKLQGQVVLGEVAKALATYSSLFGSSPYPSLSIVESPFFDGMEYDGLFFLSQDFYTAYDGTVLNNLIDIAVHETAHQWWFSLVGNDQALEPWLDEALATYSEELFFERNYPDVTAWWFFRVDSFYPSGKVDTDIYHGGNFRTYANAVYLCGARFLGSLRARIGDEVFFAFIKDYASQMAGKQASGSDFFRILREHSDTDLFDIISMYFQQSY